MLPLRGEGIDATPGAAGRDRRAHHPEPVHEVDGGQEKSLMDRLRDRK